jgi:L-aspartate oxidase
MAVFHSNFLVIGSGVAGLKASLDASKHGTVNLVTKKDDFESNTNYAQGGIASVLDQNDSFESHIRDTHSAGGDLCHPDAVKLIVTKGPEAIAELIRIGVEFSRNRDGSLELGREGGHSKRRIVHAKDLTGREVERSLLAAVRDNNKIRLYQYHQGVDLILDEDRRCWGAKVWDERNHALHIYLAGVTILSTGGCGLVYRHSTNPPVATGDGIAMAYRAGVRIANMEFIQFHPTAFYDANKRSQPFLISEAVRGEGAILRSKDGRAILENYHELKDLAPRDIVARALDAEMKDSGEPNCYLDVTHIDQQFFQERFPFISQICNEAGLDLATDWIPIVPAAHYSCGGIFTDLHGWTSIDGLYCTGESAHTGVHGANRLASNSILEALVFSQRAIEAAVEREDHLLEPPQPDEDTSYKSPDEKLEPVRLVNCRHSLRSLMWDYVGIVRSTKRLKQARKRLQVLQEEIDSYIDEGYMNVKLIELRNLILCGDLIILSALQRKESRGLHYTIDYPEMLDVSEDTVIQKSSDNTPQISSVPIPQE